MKRPFHRAAAGRAGFTLVELVTVIAILGILVTLSVGGIQAVQHSIATSATKQMFRALEAALNRYYQDWGAYPYLSNVNDSYGQKVMGLIDTTSTDSPYKARGYASVSGTDEKKAFMLYVALNLDRRKGPYFEGTGAAVVQVPTATAGRSFPAYADGWGRPIGYDSPVGSSLVPAARRKAKPLLTSKGAKTGETSDDLNNYKD